MPSIGKTVCEARKLGARDESNMGAAVHSKDKGAVMSRY